jgi:ribosomal protein S18 acetylase RimI-like enzyme
MSASCTVRPAAQADSPAILACLEEAFAPYRDAYTPGAYADTILDPERLADRFATMTILVAATVEGAVVGTIAAGIEGERGHLRGMAVRIAWQGQGVAQQLLLAAESLFHSRGCSRVTLDSTAPLTRAMRFYLRSGYTWTGRVHDFYGMELHEFAKDLKGS